MKLSALATLNCVIRKGSFAAAAEERGLTPSAVSQQMHQLELYFGQPLFDRSLRTVSPTPFAHEVVASVADTLQSLDALRDRRSPSISGRVRLGVVNSVQVSTLPACLLHARQNFPDLDIQLMIDTSAPLLHALRAGSIDIAIVVRPESGGSSRLEWFDLRRESFVMLAPAAAPALTAARIAQTLEWVRYTTATTGGRIAAQFVKKLAPSRKPALELQSTDAIVAMVAGGLGFTVLPRPREPLLRGYAVREIGLGKRAPERTVSFACRRGEAESRRVAAVLKCVRFAYEAAA
jgi:DNA-binding transcriptional LysR family regulator